MFTDFKEGLVHRHEEKVPSMPQLISSIDDRVALELKSQGTTLFLMESSVLKKFVSSVGGGQSLIVKKKYLWTDEFGVYDLFSEI